MEDPGQKKSWTRDETYKWVIAFQFTIIIGLAIPSIILSSLSSEKTSKINDIEKRLSTLESIAGLSNFQIDFSKISNVVITDAQITSVSSSKIIGQIDFSKIGNVIISDSLITGLSGDKITGFINGDKIINNTISSNKLSTQVINAINNISTNSDEIQKLNSSSISKIKQLELDVGKLNTSLDSINKFTDNITTIAPILNTTQFLEDVCMSSNTSLQPILRLNRLITYLNLKIQFSQIEVIQGNSDVEYYCFSPYKVLSKLFISCYDDVGLSHLSHYNQFNDSHVKISLHSTGPYRIEIIRCNIMNIIV